MEKSTAPLIIIAIFLLLLANISFWLSKTLYNPQNFSNLVVQTYEQDDVRNALASEIVDNTLQSKPIVKQVIGDPVKSAISGILRSQVFKSVLERVAIKFQTYLTTNNRQDVTIEIGQVATFIKAAATTISPDLGAQVPDTTPQTITLIKSNNFPDINKWAKPIMNIGPFAGLISFAILIYLIYKAESRGEILKRIGKYLLVGSLLFILIIPYSRTILQSNISDQNAEIIATATFNTFASILTTQLAYLVIISILLYVIGIYLARPKEEIIENNK